MRGAGLMRVADEECEVQAGSCVFIPPGASHAIRNTGSELLVFVSATAPPIDVDALEPVFRCQAR